MASRYTRVKLSQLNNAILHELNYATDEYRRHIAKTADKAGELAVKTVQSNIRGQRIKGTRYYRSIHYDANTDRVKTTVIIYSRKHYRLTHLLENGHAIVTRTRKATGKRTEERPHWRPAEIAATKYFINECKKFPK